VAGRNRLLPGLVRELLDRLGVPLNGEIEVAEVPGEQLPHLYLGWYMIRGQVEARPADPKGEFDWGGWRLWFRSGSSYKVNEFENREVFELQFYTEAGDFFPRTTRGAYLHHLQTTPERPGSLFVAATG
jgi:hypothetical protein